VRVRFGDEKSNSLSPYHHEWHFGLCCYKTERFLIPPTMYLFYPLKGKKSSVNINRTLFLVWILHKFSIKKSLIYVYRTFSRCKRYLDGGKSSLHKTVARSICCHFQSLLFKFMRIEELERNGCNYVDQHSWLSK
jgi:hypothetical protein